MVDVELGTYARIAAITITVTDTGAQPPSQQAVKIASDPETSKDLYAETEFKWVPP